MVSKKEEIKAIIFDIGGVLSEGNLLKIPRKKGRPQAGSHEYVAKKLGITLDQYFDSIDSVYADSIAGRKTKKQVLNVMARNLKTTPAKLEKLYVKSYRRHFKKNRKLYRLAFKLKKKGYKIAILSDQNYISKQVLASPKLTKNFDAVIISCNVGIRKPDPKIYRLTLKKLKLPARQTVFIDNQTWNLMPAKKLGMKTILFKSNAQTFKALERLGVKWKQKIFSRN